MNFKKACVSVFVIILAGCCNIPLFGQCPEISTTIISNTSFCAGDNFTITLTGQNLPDGGTIDFYLDPGSGFDPYNGEGQYIGSSDITTPCAQGPTILFAMINPPPGPDRCDEFLVIHTGSGLSNINDIIVDSNLGFNPFVSGNPNNFSGCIPTILHPGEPVPPNAILIIQGAYNTYAGDIYDISMLCTEGLPIYVIASSNTDCGGGHYTNSGTQTYGVSTPCGDDSFTYNGISVPQGSTWDNVNGFTLGATIDNFNTPSLINSPSSITQFNYTIPSDFCVNNTGGIFNIIGIINPTPSLTCSPLETTDEISITINCSAYELIPAQICSDLNIFNLNDLLTPSGTGIWAGPGLPIVGTNLFPTGASPGVYNLTFTPTSGVCPEPVSTTIEIVAAPQVSISLDNTIFCLDPSNVIQGILNQGSATGGIWAISPSGIIDPLTGLIENSSLVGGALYTVSYSVSQGDCTVTESVEFTTQSPDAPALNSFPDICNVSSPIPLPPIQDGISGMWSGPGVNAPGNQFDPSGLLGTITLTFSPNPGQCASENTVDINIVDETPIIISGIPDIICNTEGPISLPIFQSGIQGTWAGLGVTNNTFNPAGLTGFIPIQFTPALGQCGETPPPFIINVNEGPDAFNIGILTECGDENLNAVFNLIVQENAITGGSGATVTWFSNVGLTMPINNPGSYPVTGQAVVYAVVSLNGCEAENVIAVDLSVNSMIDIEVTPDPAVICQGLPVILSANVIGGGSADFIWTGPAGNIFNGTSISVTQSGLYEVIGDSEGCGSIPLIIEVFESQIVVEDFMIVNERCGLENGSIEVIASGGTGSLTFEWAGYPFVNGSVLTDLEAGVYSFRITDDLNCSTNPIIITIENAGEIDFVATIDDAVCHLNNGSITIFPLGQSPFEILWNNGSTQLINNNLLPGSYSFTLTDAEGCSITDELFVAAEGNTPELSVTGPQESCEGESVTFTFEFTSGEAPFEVIYSINGVPQPALNSVQDIFTHDIILSVNSTLEITSYSANDCSGIILPDEVEIEVIAPLEISNVSLTCLSSTSEYIVTFQISGGSGNPIQIIPGGMGIDEDGLFTSAPITIGTGYNFSISQTGPCPDLTVSGGSIVNCNCTSTPATMPSTHFTACVGESVTIIPEISGTVNPPDIFQYILHNMSGNTIGNEILRTSIPTIAFDTGLGMIPGTVYYFSFVVGPDDGTGNVDLEHDCTFVSSGTPVTWFDEVTLSIINDGPYCENEPITIEFLFDGAGPYTIEYILDGEMQPPLITNDNPFFFNIDSGEIEGFIEIISVSTGNCEGILNGNTLIETVKNLSANNLSIECNEETGTYIISFEIEGGNTEYTFTSDLSGVINGSTVVSNPVNIGQDYLLGITSGAACDTLLLSGSGTCINSDCMPEDVPVSLTNTNLSICPGTFVVVELNLESASGDYSFRWNVPYDPFVIAGYPLNASAGGDYSVVVTDQETGCESDTLFFSILENESPLISNLERICNEENDQYTIIFEISGGDPENYMVAPSGSGVLSGNIFTSNPINVGTSYIFTVSDGGLCIPPPVSGGSPSCNACELEAGIMSSELITICFEEDVIFEYLGGYNGALGSDTLFYVLSSNPNPIGSSILFFNSPTIPWSVLLNLTPGQIYYFSAIAAPIGSDGMPELDSECVSLSNPTPFLIAEAGTLTVNAAEQICTNEPLIIEFNYSGALPYTITFEQDGILRTFTGLTTNSVLVLDPEDFSESINIISVTGDEGCEGVLEGTLMVNKVPPIEIGEIRFECNFSTGNYQVIFPISGISPSDLILCGQFGIINSGVFYSTDIPMDVGYNICITNSFRCDTINIFGDLPVCESCEIEAGQISGENQQFFCTSNPNSVFTITRSSTGFSNNTGEVIRFYLVRNFPVNSPSDIISTSLTPSFSINNPTINQSYYIYGIAGEDDGTGFPDLGSDCLDTTNVIEIIFYRNVVREIFVDVCPGGIFEIDGEIFDENNPAGQIIYEGMATNGCDSILLIQLEFNSSVDSLYSDVLCAGEVINLNGTVFNENNPTGQIILDANTSGDCDTIINVMLTFLSPIYTQEEIILCQDESITIDGIVYDAQNPTGEILYENGSVNGCDSTVRISVTFTTLDIDLLTMNSECIGVASGSLSLFDNSGSGNVFEIIINEESTFTTLPYELQELGVGSYTIRVIDGMCVWDSTTTINPENNLTLTLGQTIQASSGETVQIQGEANFIPVNFSWEPAIGLSCTACLNPVVTVIESVTYTLTITDVSGCTASSQVSILVEKPNVDVYIPNSFSPNFDGLNDDFMLYADDNYISEYKMSIFNRWGDLVYSADKLIPNIPIGSWNGTFKGNRLPPDVFVYMIEAKIAGTNEIKIFAGDVTLLQ